MYARSAMLALRGRVFIHGPAGRVGKTGVAERVGFEPTKSCPLPHFECGALDHYATPPGAIMTDSGSNPLSTGT